MMLIEKTLDGSPIHYWTNNTTANRCILFLHPAFGDHTCFDEQVAYFSERYKVITVDLIGHGNSLGNGSMSDMSGFIRMILDAENIQKINLVGVSLGAVLAQDFANKYPQHLSALCCIGGYDINHFDVSLQHGNSKEQMKMMLKAMVSIKRFAEDNKRISAYTERAQAAFYEINLRFKKRSFRHLASLGSMINRQETPRRDYPLFIGVGEHDSPMAIQASASWHAHEPDSRFVIFKNAGHLVNMDAPEDFHRELENLLNDRKNE